MKFGKYLLRIVVLVSVLLTLSVQADAHTLWVNFTDICLLQVEAGR